MSLSLTLFPRSGGGQWAEEADIPPPVFPRNRDLNKKKENIPNANKNDTTIFKKRHKSSMIKQDFYLLRTTINQNRI